MDEKFLSVLKRYNDRAEIEEHDMLSIDPSEALSHRDRFLLHVGEDVGWLLRALAIGRKAQRILELGTSYGYSTLFLADAARANGGRVFTIELSSEKQAHAQEELAVAGLSGYVEWLQGDALELLQDMEGGIDFVLLDLWKELYIPCFELLASRMADGGLIAADNMLKPEILRPDAEAYRAAVRARPEFTSTLLPIGLGIELSTYWGR